MPPNIIAILPELWTAIGAPDVKVLTVALLVVLTQFIQFAANGSARRLDAR